MQSKVRLLAICVCATFAGCVGLPEQKIQDGAAGCVTVTSIYGKASGITLRADNVPKGVNSDDTMKITCGDAVMEISGHRNMPVPPPANPAVGSGTPAPVGLPANVKP